MTGVTADERLARASWSALVEPGDAVAGALVATLGPVDAWAWTRHAVAHGVDDALRSLATAEERLPVPAAVGARLRRAVARWAARIATVDPHPRLDALAGLGGRFVVPGDDGWPAALDDLGTAAPFGLWVRGSVELRTAVARSVAVVGARASTTYGERVAHDLAAGLVERGVCVVSGGAFGIDAAAHRGALARDGQTVVVLAGGVDRPYPRGNARLLDAVLDQGGALVSEVPVGYLPTRTRFLQRNRLIAGAGRATVVVEAAWRSGAISTAHHAAGLLRPVGAVPGPVTSVASAGCHRLLRDGVAVCVTDTAEVLELAGLDGPAPDPAGGPANVLDGLAEPVGRVLDVVPLRRPMAVDVLAAHAGVSLAEAHAALGLLDLDGRVRRVGDGWLRSST